MIFFFYFFFAFPLPPPGPLRAPPKTSLFPKQNFISRHDSGWEKKKEERKKKERREKRTRRQKQVLFHNRTHRTCLLFACVETPHPDRRSSTGDVFLCAVAAQARSHDAFVSKHFFYKRTETNFLPDGAVGSPSWQRRVPRPLCEGGSSFTTYKTRLVLLKRHIF